MERVLTIAQRFLPRSAPGAEKILGELAGYLDASTWPEVAWKFSRLNGDGYPIEFTFDSAGETLRYTAEIQGPESAESNRLAAAWAWAEQGSPPEEWMRMHRDQERELRWGAWVSGAHRGRDVRRKTYVEATSAFAENLDLATLPNSKLRLAGLARGGQDVEYYFRRDKIETAELGGLLRSLGWAEFFAPLREAVGEMLPRSYGGRILPTDAGYSIAPRRGFSLYTFARSLWGGDGSIRKNLLEAAMRKGWDLSFYEEVTRPLEHGTGLRTAHGVLAWICVPGQRVEVRVSVRPPEGILK